MSRRITLYRRLLSSHLQVAMFGLGVLLITAVLNVLVRNSLPPPAELSRLASDIGDQQSGELLHRLQLARDAANLSMVVAIALFFALLNIAFFVARRNARQLVEPVTALSHAMHQLANGERKADVPVVSDDELGELTRSFNQMRYEIDAQHRAIVETNDKLRRFEYRFRATFDLAPAAMVMIDKAGTIVLVNAATEKLFGYARDELIGQRVELLVPDRYCEEHPANRDKYFLNPTVRPMGGRRDVFGLRSDGAEVSIEIGLGPLETEEGNFVLAAIVDISERERLKNDLVRVNETLAQNNEELEQFAYIASHDLQEPLVKISSYCQLLKEDKGDRLDEEGIEFLDVAIDGAERLRTLIRDLLEFCRITTRGKPVTSVNPNRVIQAVIDNLEVTIEESEAEITVDEFPPVMADESQLALLLQNLIGNAMKYRKEVAPRIHIGGRPCEQEFEFCIKDNGIGIDPKHFEKVFVIFQRLHNRHEFSGTGIGLAVCKRIVQRSGGRIWVESTPGQGSAFYFTLPLGENRPAREESLGFGEVAASH
ncbi:sensor histidine kinase [Blastopirellula retiformator]|uniref:histidine kinase n=1 Tax=Blastopirellula retiformator TaxID=2527970 RepID=A0A5C5VNL7_9BACT|nr:ATP-binding protein [Blastopirellula retiformator]TWT39630.1 Phytochrome-like protein cph1 [Blastopirellula retiformator]